MSSYRFKGQRTYASTEWLAFGFKKYRNVFVGEEVDYLYFELALFNLKYGVQDWQAKINIICYKKEADGVKKICDLNFDKTVSSNENIFYLREGWGNSTVGKFWKKGEYFWEAKIDGELVGVKTFYVEEFRAAASASIDNIISLKRLFLTEGSADDDTDSEELVSYNVFDRKETRFIYVNIDFKNLYRYEDWWLEVFLIFRTSSRELKGIASKLVKVSSDKDIISISMGWGADSYGSWFADEYTIDVVVFEQPLATAMFEVDEEFEQGDPEILLPGDYIPSILDDSDLEENVTLNDLLVKLDELIGLDDIKFARYHTD